MRDERACDVNARCLFQAQESRCWIDLKDHRSIVAQDKVHPALTEAQSPGCRNCEAPFVRSRMVSLR